MRIGNGVRSAEGVVASSNSSARAQARAHRDVVSHEITNTKKPRTARQWLASIMACALALTMMPSAGIAFAAEDASGGGSALEENSAGTLAKTAQNVISSEVGEADAVEKSASIEQNEGEALTNSFEEIGTVDNADGSDSAAVIPAATQRVNEDVTLSSRTIAQAESTRSYFLAQTLESTRTVPIVSASLPLDTGMTEEVIEPAEGDGDSGAAEGEGGEDSDESDLVAAPIAAESVVVGSFEYRGITYAVEPGGESVAVVAADYSKLPEEFVEAQIIVLPSAVTFDGIDSYSVTRIADNAFSSLNYDTVSSVGACFSLRDGEETTEDGAQASAVSSTQDSSDDDSEDSSIGIIAITIPASIIEIGDDAFTGFDTLQYIIVSEDNPNYSQYDGVLYDADQTCLLLVPEGRLGAVRVAPSVTEVKAEAFSHCAKAETLVADPDSAASQLLTENGEEYKNGKGNTIAVLTAASKSELPIDAIALYEDGDSYSEIRALIDMEERRSYDASGSVAVYTSMGTQYFSAYSAYDTVSGEYSGFVGDYTWKNGTAWGRIGGYFFDGEGWTGVLFDGSLFYPLYADSTRTKRCTVLYAGNGSSITNTDSASPLIYNSPDNLYFATSVFLRTSDEVGPGLCAVYTSSEMQLYGIYSNYDVTTGAYSGSLGTREWSNGRVWVRITGFFFDGEGWTGCYEGNTTYYPLYTDQTYTKRLTQLFAGCDDSGFCVPRNEYTSPSKVFYAPMVYLRSAYVISFDADGGTNLQQSIYALDADFPLTNHVSEPDRSNYAFEGYYEKFEDGTRNFWYDGDGNLIVPVDGSSYGGYPLTHDVTLYAQWSRNNVRLDANNGSSNPTMHTIGRVVWNENVPSLDGLTLDTVNKYKPSPKADYEFDGFYTAATGGVRYYDENLNPIAAFSDDTDTLYAHWRNKNDVHNHIYCSSGIKFDSDGYAYGWTCPSYDTYVAKVYVSGTPTQSYETYVPDVPSSVPSGVMSVDAVKAGEYYLIAGGRNAAGILPTVSNPSSELSKLDAWWEITAKTADGLGTLRIHSDRGAVIMFSPVADKADANTFELPSTTENTAWRNTSFFSAFENIVLDHVDAERCNGWFASPHNYTGDATLKKIKTISLEGNTFPPSATHAASFLHSAHRLYELSDNLTLRNSALVDVNSLFAQDGGLASYPKGFTMAGTKIKDADEAFFNNWSVGAFPDGFKTGESIDDVDRFLGYYNGNNNEFCERLLTEFLQRTKRLDNDKMWLYYGGDDQNFITKYAPFSHSSMPTSHPGRTVRRGTSVTWDARGGSFSPDYSVFDTSRVYSLALNVHKPSGQVDGTGAWTEEQEAIIPERRDSINVPGDNDPFIGWYKKVPLEGTTPSGASTLVSESNGKTWAENRYLYEYEFVWDGKSSDAITVPNTNESVVYYAMYESDADKLKSDIALKMNNGTEDTFATVEGQVHAQSMKAIGRSLSEISFGNYEFDGFWTAPVGGKQYYDAKGNSAAVWTESETSAVLYAHWKYKIVFNGNVNNFTNTAGETVTASIDMGPSSIAQSGEGFTVVTPEEGSPYIEALYGAAIPLPKATREGYADTRAWGLTAGSNGQASWVMRETTDFYSAKADGTALTKATPAQATYTANGATGEKNLALTSDHVLVLYANWLWDDSTPSGDRIVPGGGKEKYTMRLKAAYKEGGITYVSDWANDALLTDVEYDSIIPEGKLSMDAPEFVSATGYDRLVFKGFYTEPNVPEPVDENGFAGVRLIAPDEDDAAKLVGTDPMRLLPTTQAGGQKEIVLYALWALPKTNVVFHLNTAGLEAPLAFSAVDDDDLAQGDDGSIYIASAETNKTIPEISIDVPQNTEDGAYTFNGWWTHPYLERGKDAVQYYGANNQRMTDENGDVLTWKPYSDTVLYAHWTYTIEFDTNPAASAALLHKAPDMPSSDGLAPDADYQVDAFGNRYFYEDLAGADDQPANDLEVTSVRAILGAPVKLPYAVGRTGYDDTCAWSVADDASTGTLPTDAGGFTLKTTGSTDKGAPAIVPGDDGRVVLYADWTGRAHTRTVALKASGYDGFAYAGLTQRVVNDSTRTKNVTATFDSALPAADAVVPTMRGYSFLGYFAEPQKVAVTGAQDPAVYAPSTKFYNADGTPTSARWTTDANGVVYAHYRQIPYTLSFSAGSNVEGDTSDIEVFYGYDLGDAPARKVAKKGSAFKGWNTKSDGTGATWFDADGKGAAGTFYLAEGDTTLYPMWEGRTYTIVWHFDWNYKDDEGTDIAYDHESLMRGDEDFDGTITVPNVSYEDEIAIPAPETVAFDFNGWYRKKWPAYVHTAPNDVDNGAWFAKTDGAYAFEPEDDAHCPDVVDFYASWSADPHSYTITLKTEGHGSSFGGGESRITLDNTYSKTEDPNDIYAEANLPAATEPGWKFAGWVETTGGGSGVPYTDEYVERGTGNRVFEAAWKVSDAKYSISFSKGVQVSGAAPYSPLDKVLMDDSARKRFFDAEGPTDEEGALALPELSAYETCGYVFDGWYRAKTGTDGKLEFVTPYEELDYADDATDFTGQELVNRAAAAKTENLTYMAKWTPKTFEVRYKATSDVSSEMKASAYAPVKLSYEGTVTLESPVFEQTTPKGSIFKYWEGTVKNPTRDPKMVPGATYTIRDLVAEAGSSSLTKRTDEDGVTVNTLWLTAEWDKMLTFTVPLVVNIVIDPERPEGTKVGEAWIETDSEQELFVESASLTRDADIATTLQAKGTDRSHDVYLTVVGDKAPADASATPLRMNLGSATNVHRDLAPHGLGTLKASADGKPGRVNLTYDLELREGVTDIGFRDFENLAAIKDVRYSDGSHMTLPVGRVFYTLSLTRS